MQIMTEYPVSLERINKYLDLTAKAVAKVSIIADEGKKNYFIFTKCNRIDL